MWVVIADWLITECNRSLIINYVCNTINCRKQFTSHDCKNNQHVVNTCSLPKTIEDSNANLKICNMQMLWPMLLSAATWCKKNIVFCYLVPCHSPKWWTPLCLQAIARRLFIHLRSIPSRTCPGSSFVFLNVGCNIEDVGIQSWWYHIWLRLLLDCLWHHCIYKRKAHYLGPTNVALSCNYNYETRIVKFSIV